MDEKLHIHTIQSYLVFETEKFYQKIIAENGISIPYMGEQKEALVGWAKEQEKRAHHDYYIFGHRHIELDLELASRAHVIILGDTFLQWTYAELDNELRLMNFEI